jgi:hypothetical protein
MCVTFSKDANYDSDIFLVENRAHLSNQDSILRGFSSIPRGFSLFLGNSKFKILVT